MLILCLLFSFRCNKRFILVSWPTLVSTMVSKTLYHENRCLRLRSKNAKWIKTKQRLLPKFILHVNSYSESKRTCHTAAKHPLMLLNFHIMKFTMQQAIHPLVEITTLHNLACKATLEVMPEMVIMRYFSGLAF